MNIYEEIAHYLQLGNAKEVGCLMEKALAQGISAGNILQNGLLLGMDRLAEQFKANDVFVPEVLIAARAMNLSTEFLKPYFSDREKKRMGRHVSARYREICTTLVRTW